MYRTRARFRQKALLNRRKCADEGSLITQYLGTVKLLKIWTPETLAVITIKFEQGGFTIE